MRLCSAVVNISHDMKLVDSKLFDGISKSNNYALSVIVADDGVKNLVVVAVKIVEIYAGSEEFFDDIRKSGVKRFTQPRTGVLAADFAPENDEVAQCCPVPCIGVLNVFEFKLNFLFRIIHNRSKGFTLVIAEPVNKKSFNFTTNNARCIVQNMFECITLTMKIAHEMLRRFRQRKN